MVSRKRVREIASRYGMSKKRKTRGSIPARASRVSVSPWSGPMPSQMFTTVRYVEAFALNPGAGTNAQYVFSANGLYDPNITGIGHQPRGFDEIMKFYNNYCVNGSKITVQCATSATATAVENIVVSVFPSITSAATVTNIWDAIEPKGCRYLTFTPGATVTTSKPNFQVNNYVNINRWLAQDTNDDNTVKGDVSSNPSTQVYWILNYFCDGGSDVLPTNFIVEIEYYAQFSRNTNLFAS